ncbi:MAG: AAA family ATPase [Acutalibacteraceae bacterium]
MLSTLHIENIAVIEQAEIAFDSGFNVLTGETGAGKSIVIDAISAILGERASREMIRTGAQKAFVGAIFSGVPELLQWFAENQIPYEPELGISREIFADGKQLPRQRLKPRHSLHRFGSSASSSSRSMARTIPSSCSMRRHTSAISICLPTTKRCWRITRQAYDEVSAVQQEIRRLSMDESEKLRLVETLKFQIDEIERAELQPGEEDELLERRKVLQNALKS